jgi:hypothetical protein
MQVVHKLFSDFTAPACTPMEPCANGLECALIDSSRFIASEIGVVR